MTRETAIALLNNLRAFAEDDDEPAIDMAIESLQREEAEEKGWCHRIRPKNVEVVVRCKDCRWWNCKNLNHQHNNHLCRYWSKFGSIDTSADDYCSYGERKGGDSE